MQSHIDGHPTFQAHVLHNHTEIRSQEAPTHFADQMWILLSTASVLGHVLPALRELDVLRQWVNVDGAHTLAVRAATLDCRPSLLALRLLLEERWRQRY